MGSEMCIRDSFKDSDGKITRLDFKGETRGLPEPPAEPVSAGVGESDGDKEEKDA